MARSWAIRRKGLETGGDSGPSPQLFQPLHPSTLSLLPTPSRSDTYLVFLLP